MPLWLHPLPLVLASKSAARRKILGDAGLPLEVAPAAIDERAVEANVKPQTPRAAAAILAREKALAVCARFPGRLVLAADQTLALGERRFSKPGDAGEARDQLRALSGRTHELHSAAAIARDGKIEFGCEDSARLTMRALSDDFIDAYIAAAAGAVTDSVGGYQIEGLGIQLFDRIEGDYFCILGLPLLPLLGHLRRGGFLAE